MKNNKGFTLIELMIVVAIIGILSMFAMPFYKTYVKKTRVSEGIGLFSAIKIAVLENHAVNGVAAVNNFLELGYSPDALYNGNPNYLAMNSPLKYIQMESAQYNTIKDTVNRFTLVFDDTFDTKNNELVMEMYPSQTETFSDEISVATYRTYCLSYLISRPDTAIQKQFLPPTCKPSGVR